MFKEKLKLLKFDIKAWSIEKFENLEHSITELTLQFNELNHAQEERDLTKVEYRELKGLKTRIWQLKKVQNSYNFQKARV